MKLNVNYADLFESIYNSPSNTPKSKQMNDLITLMEVTQLWTEARWFPCIGEAIPIFLDGFELSVSCADVW